MIMSNKKIIIIFFILIFSSVLVSEDFFNLSGYFKNYSTYIKLAEYKNFEMQNIDLGAVNNRLRLNLMLNISKNIQFNVSYDFSARIQDNYLYENNILFGDTIENDFRVDDFDSIIYPDEDKISSFSLMHNLDRFYLTINTDFADFYIGRQAISWGSGRIFNPTDVIVPFNFNELDTEDKRGVDALRVRIPIGSLSEIDMGYVFSKDFDKDNSIYFIRGKFYILNTDVALILMSLKQNLLIGFDLTRSIGGAGFWIEASYFKPKFFGDQEVEESDNLRFVVGIDYNFSFGVYAFAEYYHNTNGYKQDYDYTSFYQSEMFNSESVFFMARDYVDFGMTYNITPLIPATISFIYNMGDGSVVISPVIEYNISENMYLSAGAFLCLGEKPEFNTNLTRFSPMFILNSEFGTYPDIIYFSYRIYL